MIDWITHLLTGCVVKAEKVFFSYAYIYSHLGFPSVVLMYHLIQFYVIKE